MEGLNELIVIHSNPATLPTETDTKRLASDYVSWSNNDTKLLIDLYGKHKKKVGSLEIRNMKKLWETIANEINKTVNVKVTASNCENKWRVLDRGYKKYVSDKNKTGRGRKFFEYAEDMDRLFQKKRNIHPEILLSSETISEAPIQLENINSQNAEVEVENIYTPKRQQKNAVLNRNRILEKMREDRQQYQKERLTMEAKKIELKEREVEALIKRNILIEQRNEILKFKKCDS